MSAVLMAVFALACSAGQAAEAPPLEQIMADPDWIGPPVEAAWWQLDGSAVVYRAGRAGTERSDLFSVAPRGGPPRLLTPIDQTELDGPDPVMDLDARRALFLREGNLFLRDMIDGELTQLTAGAPAVVRAAFGRDPDSIHYLRDGNWYRFDMTLRLATAVADLRLQESPLEPDEKTLAPDQLRLFTTLADELEEARAGHEEALAAARMDPARTPPPWYLGKGSKITESELSPDGRWLLAVVEKDDGKADEAGAGKRDEMPKFVTRSGYVEVEDVRTLVGRDGRKPQRLWLLDLETRVRHELDLNLLSGLDEDPLAALKQARDMEPHDADTPRELRISEVVWHPSDALAAVMIRAIDNKDRWLATLDLATPPTAEAAPALIEQDRLTDPAWVNYAFNEFDWIASERSLWFLSEASGFSQLYRLDVDRAEVRQITRGRFEVYAVDPAADGDTALVISNRSHPTEYDLYSVDMRSGDFTRLTELLGVESFARHPGTGDVAIRHSGIYTPTQVAVLAAQDQALTRLTDTRTQAYSAIDWQLPQFVDIPSSHDAGAPIRTRFYAARTPADASGRHPAVVFVHGAGYTQNTHHRFPYYFREQMFHNLLTARGYHVIDMDYRASRGYGRDWRTAIYRQMGTPELEDLKDGVAWLVAEHDVDPARVGIYGGSYGGFMTLMAMFQAPDVFGAGAALRPVTDWAHYNHGYTSNILNTPQVDPEAYRRSSPIEFAEHLAGPLLISHGMLDDNVFYKDSVRLAQRLIELEKIDWELASYPMEPHGYEHASSWLDQYRRILKLFEHSIGRTAQTP